MSLSRPIIREHRVRTVRVPMLQPQRTTSGRVTDSPLVLTGWSAHDRTGLGEPESLSLVAGRGAVDALFRESEIEQLDDTVLGDQDVRWLEVAMDDAFSVRRLERRRDLGGLPKCFGGPERPRIPSTLVRNSTCAKAPFHSQ